MREDPKKRRKKRLDLSVITKTAKVQVWGKEIYQYAKQCKNLGNRLQRQGVKSAGITKEGGLREKLISKTTTTRKDRRSSSFDQERADPKGWREPQREERVVVKEGEKRA